ncbi:DapH/DapD/GlmU-related protein [Candidatus Carsonella ruddii]|uniref:2,3,4,5-tetrahydropyridine-2,6-carboxylate N-succinyltransferase n=1 Tax=Carsonella ruddii TaxID=114186 RepID=A0AAE7G408_CARRU|nr:DapH/DapD/GlmU-related protein [Candidatus Carsonella ruddii]AGS06508.1 tetrahydrodipicolinate N-succinyltransferase [Candidatus Carsonella ruddii DC]QLK13990.1 2,3,4,5-tetrahydropyridine-2,6-carboxylate N-succinyltransferase [Candidatus Carsonella ruddii]
MIHFSIINYKVNSKNKIFFCTFIAIKKKILFLKIKKKVKIFLNIKQTIYLMFLINCWKKIFFKNNVLLITIINNEVSSNIDGLFKLYLISKGLYKIHCINLNKIFLRLETLIWSNVGVYSLNDIEKIFKNKNNILIESIDKIPFLTKFIIPKKVRISNTNRVRLGSFISEGTTIMSEGYVNFNTFIGKNCMIEGRVSSGVYISKNTDLGGSSSIMGTLSGGGKIIISVGSNCLLGANSGIGFSLGNNCIIEAGLYITSGMKIFLIIKKKYIIVKAKVLSFINNLIFYRNSLNGRIECCKNLQNIYKINKILHIN